MVAEPCERSESRMRSSAAGGGERQRAAGLVGLFRISELSCAEQVTYLSIAYI